MSNQSENVGSNPPKRNRGPSLRSGFRQRAPAPLTPARRLNFNMEMHHYDIVPAQLQEKIIEKAKAERGEVKEEEE